MIHITLPLLAVLNADALPRTDPSGSLVQTVLSFVLALSGIVSLLLISISAFRYVISRGDPEAVKKAKNTILYAIIGLAITMSAYGIVTFVFGRLQ